MSPASAVRRALAKVALAVSLLVSLTVGAGVAPAAADTPSHGGGDASFAASLPITKAWLLLDADTGNVLAAGNERTPLRVASTFKILTALVVRGHVRLDDAVPISARAQATEALKISVVAGQRWKAADLLYSMLLASANDAAVALAERAGGGSLAGFDRLLAAEARTLGLADRPALHDPAGLDDQFSFEGGNLISARDLAIAARAFLADPLLAAIADTSTYRFAGGDGHSHEVTSHNGFLRSYPGAIGLKTGYTERSGSSLVAAARRGGRTMIAVVIDSSNTIAAATQLLDHGFAQPRGSEPHDDRLPRPPSSAAYVGPGQAAARVRLPLAVTVPVVRGGGGGSTELVVSGLLVALVALLAIRRRQVTVARLNASRRAAVSSRHARHASSATRQGPALRSRARSTRPGQSRPPAPRAGSSRARR